MKKVGFVLRVKKEGSVDRRSDGDKMKWHE